MKKISDLNFKRAGMLAGAAIAFILLILFLRGCGSTPDQPKIIPAKKIIEQVEKTEKPINLKIDSIEKRYKVLESEFTLLQKKLFAAQKFNKYIAAKKNDTTAKRANDYEAGNESYVTELIQGAAESDSLCNDAVNNLQAQILARDSIADWLTIKHNALKSQFNIMADQQIILEQSNKDYRRAIRRKKLSNIFWKSALVAAGIVILKK